MATPDAASAASSFTPDCALAIAQVVHHGQTDKAGEPYIGHVVRVMGRLDDDEQRIVAALHDVLEDGPRRGWPITPDHLRAAGVPPDALTAVVTITHPRGEPDERYWARVAQNPLARAVKLADIADNSDPDRLARLKPSVRDRLSEKYTKARAALGTR
jgi:hypothetical protein